jgi:hypothetical protein
MKQTSVCFLAMLLLVACQGNMATESNEPLADTPEKEIVLLALARALVNRRIPDHGLLADPKNVVLSDKNIPADWTPKLPGITLIMMSRAQIEARADSHGDFLYLYVSELSFTDDKTANIRVHSMWAKAEKSTVTYLSGGGFSVIYEKDGGEWKEVSSVSWIS